MIPPTPDDEALRLDALYDYAILDTPREAAYDDLVKLAAYACGAPIALMTLVDSERQWFKAKIGVDTIETSREVSFCAHAILQTEMTIVTDARQDARFADNPFVTSEPNYRFYAGAPLLTDDGHALGTLCVIDPNPRDLTLEQRDALRILSRQVMRLMDMQHQMHDLTVALKAVQPLAKSDKNQAQKKREP